MGLISRVSSRTYRFFRAITMPILNIDTNSDKVIDQNDLLKLTQAVATTLNKPTTKVLIKVNKMTMSFGGSTEPAAYVNLRSKGKISKEENIVHTQALTPIISEMFSIKPDRFFIEFYDVLGENVAFNGN